jgi:hypothetical protein
MFYQTKEKKFQTRTKGHLKNQEPSNIGLEITYLVETMSLHERVSNGSSWVSTKFNTREGRVCTLYLVLIGCVN